MFISIFFGVEGIGGNLEFVGWIFFCNMMDGLVGIGWGIIFRIFGSWLVFKFLYVLFLGVYGVRGNF